MRNIRILISLAVVLGTLALSGAIGIANAQTSDDQALEIARKEVKLLVTGDYDGAYALFDAVMTKALTKDQLKAGWESVIKTMGDYQSETAASVSVVQAYKVVSLTLQFKNSPVIALVSVNDKGQVGGLSFKPATPVKYDLAPDEQEITFKSGNDTIYGTLLIPANAKSKVPAVVLISGSGPTDRDGNSTLLQGKIDSHKNFARVLAEAGIASLRYDKYGTGKTGLASFASKPETLTFDAYVDTAVNAYGVLAARAEVDQAHMAILGHSEGGLVATLAASKLKAAAPVALMLMAPLSKPYLVTIREQIAAQYAAAVKAGQFTQKQADEGLADLDKIIAQVIKDGTLPNPMSPQYAAIFSAGTVKFLQNVSAYEPAKIAASLPPSLKVFIACGEKDVQVPCADVKVLVDGFKAGGNTGVQFVELKNVNHVFKEIAGTPDPTKDYTDPTKPFSKEATTLLTDFVKASLLK